MQKRHALGTPASADELGYNPAAEKARCPDRAVENQERDDETDSRKSRFSGVEKRAGHFFPSGLLGFGGFPVTFVNTTSSCFGQK